MLDLKFIRENTKLVEENNRTRNVSVDLGAILKLDEQKSDLQKQVDLLRAKRNEKSKTKPSPEEIAAMKKVGEEISALEKELVKIEEQLHLLVIKIPNINHESVPTGKDDGENTVLKKVGEQPKFSFSPKEHYEVEHAKAGIDLERGAKISGSRFYYLKGKLAILERALMQHAVDSMVANGFELILPPVLVKEEAMYGTGFFPADENEIYSVSHGEDKLFLVGTSEVPLIYMHAAEFLEEKDLPKKYVAITPCFRRESGSYGKDTKGLFRVHQFYKVEMVVFCHPDESWAIHEQLLGFEEKFIQSLGLPYQVMNICSGDLGFPAAKKYDCEGWFPGQGKYRELTSTSNTTDYQARRSNIKFKTKDGKKQFVHTLNGTVTSDRPLLAIIENFQQEDGSVIVPEALRKYTGFDSL